jgi:D-serine deaminase-like pyridoxal phosphate-dependent protein
MRLEDLQTPTLLIDLDAVRHNLARMRTLLGGDLRRWRPHVKTSKVPEVLRLLLDAGVRRFKCATSREAEVLLGCARAPIDLLVAMAHQGANLERFAALAKEHPQHRFAMLSEAPDHAARVQQTGMRVFVDLDPGYHRSGVPLEDRSRIAAVIAAAGDAFTGLHCYDGHLPDRAPQERAAAARAIYADLCALARSLGGGIELVTSGTPTFAIALAYEPFRQFDHTVSPGTVVYWDLNSHKLAIDGFSFAVTVQARVISHPAHDRITLDAGSKAIDAAVADPCALALGPWRLRALRPSEEHLPMQVEGGERPPLGTLLRLVPAHVCPTVNLADSAVLHTGEDVLGIVPVSARGHAT